MPEELFDTDAVTSDPPKNELPQHSIAYLPTLCKKCGATMPEPYCYLRACICCESDDIDSMQWHEYVPSLKKYCPHDNDKITTLANDLKEEWRKLMLYLESFDLASPKAEDSLNEYNQRCRSIVSGFEEKLWEGSL
ncbi:hypothetical protein PDESU_03335 [Pontiella desulfatans]|uniref:Uncharacterized protein n=1 Tax=Pontiella desulfatans TaxID=2750659 RepID=A0A6C2U5T5_PONDE|nr:hypothetical protein [Pontiella desulfatans]VGO14766.1 hypothetical protein PDESU_03335 [Pontiella desulfatans]